MNENTENPMMSAEIPNQPQGRCVICDDHLGVGNGYWRHVYAGTNPDGSGRMAHKVCWQNMRDQLWLSFGISLDELSEQELRTRQQAKPKLGTPPVFLGEEMETEAMAMKRRIEAIDNAVSIQCSDGNWNYNDYMRGLANGLLFAQAVMHDRDYEPLDAIDSQAPRPNVRGPFIRRK